MESVSNLSRLAVFTSSITVDWDELNWPEGYEFWEAEICDRCGKARGVTSDELEPKDPAEGYCRCDEPRVGEAGGPMMNCIYPIPGSAIREPDRAALKIARLPLCIVRLNTDEGYALALTGGGMNLSWEIAEAFMLLGYLPPVYVAVPPEMSGRGNNRRDQWIIRGCKATAACVQSFGRELSRDLIALEEWCRNEGGNK
jgi:hypothetical protein